MDGLRPCQNRAKCTPLLNILRSYYFVIFGALGLYLPYFPAWLEAQGFAGAPMSIMMMLSPLLSLISPPLTGMLADSLGLRGKLASFASLLTSSGMLALAAVASHPGPVSVRTAFTCMCAFALFRAPISGLADVLAMEHRAQYGRIRLWGSLGFLVTSLAGGAVLDPSARVAVPLAIGLWFLAASVIARFLPQTSEQAPRPALSDARLLVSRPSYRRLLGTSLLIYASYSCYDMLLSLRLRDLGASPALVGAYWALATVSEVGLLFLGASILRRIEPSRLLALSLLVAAMRWILVAEITSLPILLLLQPLHAITFGLMWISLMALLRRECAGLGMATAQGLQSAAISLGAAGGLFGWGILYHSAGSKVAFELAALLALLSAWSAGGLVESGETTADASATS